MLEARTRWAVLGAVLLTMFLGSLDQTVVGTALPTIATDLHGTSLYTWVVTSYLLASTITIPIYGKFSDVFGRKPMLLAGVVLFLIGSALSGASRTMVELVVFRGIQGLGAGSLFTIGLAIIGDLFTARERGRYQGLFGAVFSLSFLVGPLIGGLITDDVGWHWVFYVNLPVGIAALIVLVAVLPNPGTRGASIRDLDYLGILVFSAGVVPLLVGLTEKGEAGSSGQLNGWVTPQVGGLMLLGLLILAGFVLVEARAKEPIVPLDLFRGRDYSASMTAVFLFGIAMFTAVIFMPRFYQTVRGINATTSGYYIWPLLVGLMGGSIGAGQLISRSGRYKWLLVAGTAVLLVGSYLMTHMTATTPNGTLWAWMLVLGLGMGPAMAGFTVVVQNAVAIGRIGVATSTLTFFRQIGGSVGLAIADTVFASSFANQLPRSLAARAVPEAVVVAAQHQSSTLQGVGNLAAVLRHVLPPQLHPFIPAIVAGVHEAFALSVASLFWITLSAAGLGLLTTLLLRNLRLKSAAELRQEMEAGVPAE